MCLDPISTLVDSYNSYEESPHSFLDFLALDFNPFSVIIVDYLLLISRN